DTGAALFGKADYDYVIQQLNGLRITNLDGWKENWSGFGACGCARLYSQKREVIFLVYRYRLEPIAFWGSRAFGRERQGYFVVGLTGLVGDDVRIGRNHTVTTNDDSRPSGPGVLSAQVADVSHQDETDRGNRLPHASAGGRREHRFLSLRRLCLLRARMLAEDAN